MILQNHRFLLCNASKCGQFRVNLVESLEKVGLRHSMGSKNTFLTQSSRKSSGDIIIVSKYSNCQVSSPKKCKPNVPFPNGSADVQCLSSLFKVQGATFTYRFTPWRNCHQPQAQKGRRRRAL